MGQEKSFIHDSIADIHEGEFVERLLSDRFWSTDLFQLAGMPQEMATRQNVPLFTAPGNYRGDIDVLRCNRHRPDQAVAYQFKRIKCGISHIRSETPSKLHEFEKVAQQANLLSRMGLWQVYVYVVVVADTREQNFGKVTYAGLSSMLGGVVDNSIRMELLNEKVGLVVLDFTQPMDYQPFTVGTHGLHLRRLATPSAQAPAVTDWIAGLFANVREA